MRYVLGLCLIPLLVAGGSVSYAFESLHTVLENTQADLEEQLATSSNLLLSDVRAFEEESAISNDYNNLLCLGLGSLSVLTDDVVSLSVYLDDRIQARGDELSIAIDTAIEQSGSGMSDVVEVYYEKLLRDDVAAFDSSYQKYFNTLVAEQRALLEGDQKRFADLAASNADMLASLTQRRIRLAAMEVSSSSLSGKLAQWDDAWQTYVEDVSLYDVILDDHMTKLQSYFASQHARLATQYPDVSGIVQGLAAYEDELVDLLEGSLESFFENYLGFYVLSDGSDAYDDFLNVYEAYYLADDSMDCPVIVGGWKEESIALVEKTLAEAHAAFSDTLIAFDGFDDSRTIVAALTTATNQFYTDFLAEEVVEAYRAYSTEVARVAQERYTLNQDVISRVSLPYSQGDLLAMFVAAGEKYDDVDDFKSLLRVSADKLGGQIAAPGLTPYKKALYTLLYETILVYLDS